MSARVRFIIYGNFPAENIDDALAYLRDHFAAAASGESDASRPCVIEVRRAEPGEVVELRAS